MEVKIKMIMVLPYPKSMVFQAITNAPQLWNPEIDIFNIKTARKATTLSPCIVWWGGGGGQRAHLFPLQTFPEIQI